MDSALLVPYKENPSAKVVVTFALRFVRGLDLY